MASLEARVVQVEEKVDTFRTDVAELKGTIGALEERMDRRFAELKEAIAALDQRMERRFETIDRRFEAVDRRFEAVDRRLFSIIGLGVMTLLAMLTGLLNVFSKQF